MYFSAAIHNHWIFPVSYVGNYKCKLARDVKNLRAIIYFFMKAKIYVAIQTISNSEYCIRFIFIYRSISSAYRFIERI